MNMLLYFLNSPVLAYQVDDADNDGTDSWGNAISDDVLNKLNEAGLLQDYKNFLDHHI